MSEHQVQQGGPQSTQSTAALLKALSRELSDLVHAEVRLARAELAGKATRAGAGVSILVVAGGLVFFAGGALVAAAVAAMSQVMSIWLAAVIAAGGLIVIAALAALVGRRQLARGRPLAPEKAIEDTKEEVEWLRTQARSARR